jgi:hypothetical protein
MFKNGAQSVEECPWPGQAHLVRKNRRITISETAMEMKTLYVDVTSDKMRR